MTTANDILSVARKEVGTKESPPNSNRTKYGRWYGLDGYAWCMMFVQWVFAQCGAGALLPVKTASCTELMNAARKKGLWVTSGYQPGDVLIFDWERDGVPDHTGILEKALGGGKLQTIEGNTAVGNDSNGGEVMQRKREVSQVLGAVRPKYGKAASTQKEEKKMDDKEIYEAVERYSSTLGVPANLQDEFQEAIDMGITDGSSPGQLVPAWRSAIMAKRAIAKILCDPFTVYDIIVKEMKALTQEVPDHD